MGAYGSHHFVPQFYLRLFALDERQRQINLYLIDNRRLIRSVSIRDQAQRHKLYGSDEREKTLAGLERITSPVIRRMVELRQVPIWQSGDHATLITYVLLQAHRTPTADCC